MTFKFQTDKRLKDYEDEVQRLEADVAAASEEVTRVSCTYLCREYVLSLFKKSPELLRGEKTLYIYLYFFLLSSQP